MDEKTLNNLSIFELRDLARKVGVFNPTVLKKSNLISAICDIQSGKALPHVSKTKQGRPPKEIGGYDKLVEIFLPSDALEIPTKEEKSFSSNSDELVLHSDPNVDDEVIDVKIVKGYLDVLENGCGLIRPRTIREIEQQDLVFVSNKNMINYNLKGGDEIVCRANLVRPDRAMVMLDILEINNISIKDYDTNRSDFDNMPINFNNELIKSKLNYLEDKHSNNIVINYGNIVYCYPEKSEDFRKFAISFAQDNAQCFDNIIYLSPILTPKKSESLKATSVEIFATDFCDSFANQRRTVFLAYNRAKRLAEMGKNICFIIDDLYSLLSIDKDFYGDLIVSKSVISLGRRFDNGSVTVFCNIPDTHQKYAEGIVLSTFKVVESVGLKLKDGKVDGANSYVN